MTLWHRGGTLSHAAFNPGLSLLSGFLDLVYGCLTDLNMTWCLFYNIGISVMLIAASLYVTFC